jgi:hypothetical protein
MRHIAIRDFVLQDWTERNIFALAPCASNANASDMFTKQIGKILFARHNDHMSGHTTFFRINPYLLIVPRHAHGSRGVLVSRSVLSGVPGFSQPHSKYTA